MPAKRYYNISRSVLAVLFLLLGGYGGYLVFTQVLGTKSTEQSFKHAANTNNEKKTDTVFVKVVNPSFNTAVPAATQSKPDTAAAQKNGANRGKQQQGLNEQELPPQLAPFLAKHTQQDISSNIQYAAGIAGGMKNKTEFKSIFNGWHVWAALGVSLVILLVAFFTKDDALANATLKDVPPAILETLFAELRPEINLFRNPRKILRYRNAVSYHYFFFKQKGLDTPGNVLKMMNLLLAIHRSPELVDTRPESEQQLPKPGDVTANTSIPGNNKAASARELDLSKPDWFAERFAKSRYSYLTQINLPEDEEMVMLVLKLNADMG